MMDKEVRNVGKNLMRGALDCLSTWLLIAMVMFPLGAWAGQALAPTDPTDSRGGVRSGMKLRTDWGTGCQYLETSRGDLTPRLGADGRQVCQ